MDAVGKSNVQQTHRHRTRLPADIDQYAFKKFTEVYFRSHVWGCKREPIRVPFLTKNNETDAQESVALFRLVMRYMNDMSITGQREKLLADWIVQRGLKNEALRDEILCQICNQTWKNDSQSAVERAWQLISACLSCFPPSHVLYKYLLKFVSDHAYNGYVGVCQQKMLRGERIEPQNARTFPPTWLEYKASLNKCNTSLQATFSDGEKVAATLDSWATGEEFATGLLAARNIDDNFGWTVELVDEDGTFELNGNDYVFDLIADRELMAGFPASNHHFLVSPDRAKQRSYRNLNNATDDLQDYDDLEPLPPPINRRYPQSELSTDSVISGKRPETTSMTHSSSVMSLDRTNLKLSKSRLNQRYTNKPEAVRTNSDMKLSESSRLNKRYVSNGQNRVHEKPPRKLEPQVLPLSKRSLSLQELGLATSALNERYFHSKQDLHKAASVTSKTDFVDNKKSMLKKANDYLEEEEPQLLQKNKFGKPRPRSRSSSSISSELSTENDKNDTDSASQVHQKSIENISRYVKNSGKPKSVTKYPPYSAKASIDKLVRDDTSFTGFHGHGPRSSAMSDTSEAPSLASHVRNVKIPSLTSDLDQYLDDLFNPVLDGTLDELSDARSLAASIKGGGHAAHEQFSSLDVSANTNKCSSLDDIDLDTEFDALESSEQLAKCLMGGGDKQTKSFGTPGRTGDDHSPRSRAAPDSPNNSASNMPFTNVAGMTVPMVDTSQVIQQQLVHQQMIQRAFLASAVQQNLQIQQQLLQQNQALQQLLQTSVSPGSPSTGNSSDETVPLPSMSPITSLLPNLSSDLLTTSPFPQSSTPVSIQSYSKPSESRKFGPIVPPKVQDVVQDSKNATGRVPAPPPPPPPSPPPLSPSQGATYTDVYGRAKTVRIGKWRWPPPRDESTPQAPANSFFEFKMKKQTEKHQEAPTKSDSTAEPPEADRQEQQPAAAAQAPATAQKQAVQRSTSASGERESICIIQNGNKVPITAASSPPSKLVRPLSVSNLDNRTNDKSVVGKLRISSDMKAKLEQLTTDQSVRGSKPEKKDKVTRSMDDITQGGVKKLSEQRKALLEKQLMGSLRGANLPPEPPARRIDSKENVVSKTDSSHKLPDDGLVKIEGRFAPSRRSGASREVREMRDELGPLNRTQPGISERHGPGTIASTVKAECGDHLSHSMAGNFFDDLSTRNGSVYEESIASSVIERKPVKRMNVPPPPPPGEAKKPMMSKHRSVESVKNSSVAASSTFYNNQPLVARRKDHASSYEHNGAVKPRDYAIAPDGRPSKANQIKTKVQGPAQSCLTYSSVGWELRARKEVRPSNFIKLHHRP